MHKHNNVGWCVCIHDLVLRYIERSLLYTCCRDGQYKQHKGPKITNLTRKHKQSRKLEDSYCLARMTATENIDTGKVSVSYISVHTNHELNVSELKYVPLPSSVRKEVEEKTALGIPIERITDGELAI